MQRRLSHTGLDYIRAVRNDCVREFTVSEVDGTYEPDKGKDNTMKSRLES